MGIAYIATQLFLREKAARPFSGRVLQLGRQDVTCNPPSGMTCELNDQTFFRWLGFSEVHSCDASNYEKPTFKLDLNYGYPQCLGVSKYDLIHDGGTLEHVFDVPNALRCIHDMLKVGGRVIHHNPASNYVDHGFYSFSPTFYWDYYEANGYRIEACYLIAARHDEAQKPRLYEYTPGCSVGGERGACSAYLHGGNDIWDTFFVATKLPGSTCGVIPQQRRCREMWERKSQSSVPLKYLGEM